MVTFFQLDTLREQIKLRDVTVAEIISGTVGELQEAEAQNLSSAERQVIDPNLVFLMLEHIRRDRSHGAKRWDQNP